jgi:amino acid adenylation domain-containing protein
MKARQFTAEADPVRELLEELARCDIHLRVENGALRYDAPAGAFSDQLKARVREHKAGLLTILTGRPDDQPAPLSCQQERMWFLNRLEGSRGLYVEFLVHELRGALDEGALVKALDWLVARHPALRSVFRDGPQGPEQVALPAGPAHLTRLDLSAVEHEAQATALAAALADCTHQGLDLARGPVARFVLVCLEPRRHVLALAAHHAAVDGWSGGIILHDLALAYNACQGGQAPAAPPPDTTYAAYAVEQRRQVDDGSLDRQAAAWARELEGVPLIPGLPLDHPRPAALAGRGAELALSLSPEEVAALTVAGRRRGVTFFAVLLAAYGVVQAKASGRRRLLVGVPTAGRARPELEPVVGYFSNTVPVLLDLRGAESFDDAAPRAGEAVLAALARQDIPLEHLIRAVAPPRSPAYAPLFQTMFSLQPRPANPPALAGLTALRLTGPPQPARYDLTLVLGQTVDGGVEGSLIYDADLFDPARAEGWRKDFLGLLAEAAAGADFPLNLPAPARSSGSPGLAAPQAAEGAGLPPATPTEKRLAELWAEFLDASAIARQDDFFLLGGHSLLLMRLVNRISAVGLGQLELAEAMGATTLSAMAALLDDVPSPAISRAAVGQPSAATQVMEHPASPGQEGMWLERRDRPVSVAYSVPFRLELAPEQASPELIQAALKHLSARQAALRTVFVERDGVLLQRVSPAARPDLVVHDLRKETDLQAVQSALAAVAQADYARPFDLANGPLFRFHLCLTAIGSPVLIGNADHAVFDGWSLDILRRELRECLAALAQGRPPELPALSRSYAQAALAWREDLAGERGEILRAFWRERLTGLDLGGLPQDGNGVDGQTQVVRAAGSRLFTPLSPEASAGLDRLAAVHHATPAVVWTAAVAALLSRYKDGQAGVAVGVPFAGRRDACTQDLIGYFVNLLPVRLPGEWSQGMASMLAVARSELLSVMQHQDTPLSWLTAEAVRLGLPPSAPLFDAVATLAEGEKQDPGLVDQQTGAGKFPLMLTLARQANGDTLAMEYDPARFSSQRVDRLAEHLQRLLVAAAAEPQKPLGELDIISPEERSLVVVGFNRTDRDYPRDASLAALFRNAAAQHAHRPALVWPGGALTYAELDHQSDCLATGLAAAGAQSGEVVGLALERGPAALAAILGVVKAGCAYLPLDPGFPPGLVSRLLDDAGAKLVLADAPSRERLAGTDLGVRLLALDELPQGNSAGESVPLPDPQGGQAPAYVMFTSGTTGEPKGVMVPQRAVVRLALNTNFLTLAPEDGVAQAAPLGFDAATLEIWSPLLNGARVCLVEDAVLTDPAALRTSLTTLGVSVMWLTASLMNLLAEEDPACFGSLRVLLSGGEALSAPHVQRVLEACPNLRLLNGYGPTENTTFTTTHEVAPAEAQGGEIPLGRPIAGTTAYVLDCLGNPAPLGVWGELYAGGDGLALGYAGRPDLSAAAFLSPTWLPGQRLYRTGDLARWREDGVLLFGGRRDGQVKVRGRRVEMAAVESALRSLPGVGDAAVLVLGQGGERTLAAAVVAQEQAHATWRAALSQRLPAFMVPERFLVLPRLPVTANGKADRRVLAQMLERGPASPIAATRPASAQERLLADLWGELFPGSEPDTASDFFLLGGHSLLAMRLAGLIEKRAGWRPAVRELMTARTLGAMARLLETGPASGQAESMPKASGPDFPLSSGQARLWMLARLYPDSAAYNVPFVLDLTGELDAEALQRALTALEERQHALRLRLTPAPEDPSRMRQRLMPPGDLVLRRETCTVAEDPQAEAGARVEAEVLRPFHLEREAPMRVLLLKLGPQRWRLVLTLHHAACDAWSLPVLWHDLGALYAREAGRSVAELPTLTRGYEDFAAWQQGRLALPAGLELLARWRERLTPLPEPLALPLDRPRPPQRRFRGGFVEAALSLAASQALESLAAANGATPFAALLGLLQVLLWRHTGQTDLALGTLVAGRERADLAELVGFFVNTLVLRQHIDPKASLTGHLRATSETLLTAIADQDCPFEALVEAVGAPRDTSRNPLFDVLAVWQDEPAALPELAGLAVSQIEAPFPFAKFDLGFHFFRAGGALRVQVEYDADIFERSSVEAMLLRLRYLVDQALARPEIALAEMEVLDPRERALVVEGFNATTAALDIERVIPALFLAQAAATPELPAVLWGESSLSYAQFAALAAGVAARLSEAGVRPGQVVALCARRSPEMLLGIHGILLAGGAYAPLDPDHPDARRADMLEDLGDPFILAAPEEAGLFPSRRVLTLHGGQTALAAPPPSQPGDLAYVIFTSGSTGRPKGAMIEHRSALNRMLWMQQAFPLGAGDVILQKTPITFDVSVWELFWWSWTGAAVALAPPGAERDPEALVEAVARHGVTVMHFVPSMLAEFLSYLENGRAAVKRLGGLRYVFASGEALDAGLVERFNRLLHEPYGVELHNLYGPTEAAVDVSWQPCSPWPGGSMVPIGRPIANTRLYVLDPDLKPLPVGVAGEVCIGGAQVGRGYINRPELTAERFVADPFVPGGRIYRTGDLGRWRTEGTIEYLGRGDHQVKVRGHRIELAEIEHALQSHPGVERAVVVSAQAAGLVELHAYILGDSGLDDATLRGHLRRSLPEYMLPARFLRLDELPLTTSGKVNRKALAGRPLGRAEEAGGLAPFEAEVLAIWRKILPGASLGPRDSFFDAGGNSLLLIRLHERLDARWRGVFSVADLFGRPTVADQAALLTGALPAPRAEITPRLQAGPVAIVGLAVRLTGCEDLDTFWADLAGGVDRVRPLPAQRETEARALLAVLDRPAPAAFREAAYLDDVYGFDPRRQRLSPMDATLLDPEQRLFLEAATAALEDAGYGGSALDKTKVGVFAGASPLPYYREAMARLHPERTEQIFALNVPSNLATRLSFLHDWRGPAALVDTACSSGLAAVHLACRALAQGECQAALVGSAKALLLPPSQDDRLTIDSSTARTRAFAAEADGTGMGEGAVAMLLKPLELALADGDAIHAVILGSALNQDGASSGMAAPNPEAQAEVISAAAQNAEVGLESLSYVEAHGTGTALGDPIEIAGLTRAFTAATTESSFAAIGAVKGNYGHLDAAAGVLGLAKAVLCLKHDAAPPQPFFAAPNPRIDFAHAPVRVPLALEPLADRGGPRRAGVSSFGLSGINAHVIVEAAPTRPADQISDQAWHVAGLSAASEKALRRYARELAVALRAAPDWSLASASFTLALGRESLSWRAALAVAHSGALLAWLDDLSAGKAASSQIPPPGSTASTPNAPACASVRQEAEAAAQTFLAGGVLTWPAKSPRPRRLHLPPTPYVRRICRPDFSRLATAKPLLGAPVTTPQGWAWRVPLDEPDFWPMSEHRLEGRPTLVGMALPGLLTEAARVAGLGGMGLRIMELVWLRPLRAGAITPGSASLLFSPASDEVGGELSLGAQDTDGQWEIFARGRLSRASASASFASLAGTRARCVHEVASPSLALVSGQVEVSRRWDCRIRVWLSADGRETLALLRLSTEFAADCLRFPLHPALLDVAASLALNRPGRLPAACAEMRILGPLPTETLVHVVRRQADDHELLADVTIYDPTDEAAVLTMTGLRFVSPGASSFAPLPAMSLPAWRTAPLPAGATCPGPLALVGEGELARRLAAGLAEDGLLAGQCGSANPDPVLLQALLEGRCAGLLLAPAGGEDLTWRAASVLRYLLTNLKRPVKVLLAGHGAYALDEADPSPGPEAGLLAGLALAAAQEEPLLTVRYLDLDLATPPAQAAAEFAAFTETPAGPLLGTLLRGERRYAQMLLPLPTVSGPLAWPENGCCLVTGGLGGFALTLAEELANGGRLTLALLSRGRSSESDGPEADFRRERLAELARAGVRCHTYVCDVTDRASLEATLAQVRSELGPITAVAHAAGQADGAFLLRREHAEFQTVLAAKVLGARHLDELTRQDPLRAFVLFGSLTGLTGAPGQTAYAAANAYLAALAHWRRIQGLPALCLDWCSLDGVGMAAHSQRGRGIGPSMDAAGARAAWRAALSCGRERVTLLSHLPTEESAPVSSAARPAFATEPAAQEKDLAQTLAAIWAQVLGYEQVGQEDNFFSLGGDSITAMQIVNRIMAELGQPASLAMLFEQPTPAGLALALDRAPASAPEARLEPAPPAPDYPLAWEQLAVIQAEAAGDMGTAFNLACLVELPAGTDQERLRAALERLVARHEILRTRFLRAGDEFRMQVLPPSPLDLPVVDIPIDQDIWKAGRSRVRPFDLFAAPPLRVELLRPAQGSWMLFLDLHHALADGLSQEVLLAELAELYAGNDPPAPGRQFKDYAWWSREGAGAKRLDEDRAWWRERFAGPLPLTDLPAEHPRPARHTWRGDTVFLALEPNLLKELRAYAAASQVSVFAVVLAAWAALIHRLARSDDVVIAVPVDSRDLAGMPDLPGMLVSLLPLRLAVSGSEPTADLVRRAQAAHAEALGHRSCNLGLLLADLAPPASPDRTLLSEVTLSYMNFAEAAPAAGQSSGFKMLGLTRDSCKNDLGIFVRDLPGQMLVSLEYYADLFDRQRMEDMGRQFQTLLAGMVRGPSERTVAGLPLLNAGEQERLLAWGRGASPELPLESSVFALFCAQAAWRGESVAVEETGRQVTYAELRAQALVFARGLAAAGVGPGDRVAVHMRRGYPVVAALLGVLAAGAAYVPLDPAYPAERNRFLLADARCRVVLADTPGREALGQDTPCPVLATETLALALAASSEVLELPKTDGSWPAYVMYTSGSTGQPKGVLIPQRAVIRLALGADYAGLGPDDRVLQTGPLAFDASVFEIWGALLTGGRICVADWEDLLDPANLAALLKRFQATVVWLTAGLFNRQVEFDPASFKGVRVVITGGEALSADHARRALASCPGVSFLNGYGPTENTTFSLVHKLSLVGLDACPAAIGRPIAHSCILVLDSTGGLVPQGVWGEICVGGPGLAEGYWDRPELTAERFVDNPWQAGARLYRTGDLGRWRSDGIVEFGGRLDNQIKLRGLRIELEEIERALAKHPAVDRAVALLRRPPVGEPEIAAALLPAAEGVSFDLTAMHHWLGRELPAYMVPARFLAVSEIPVTANGKVDRQALLCLLEQDASGSHEDGQAPRGPVEEMVAAVFSDVFGRPILDRRSGFLDLGGHSLLAIKVVNRLAEHTGVRLAMRDFYAAASIADLAALCEHSRPSAASEIPQAPIARLHPASHSQQRLYLLHQLEGGSAAYNMCFAFRCSGELASEALAKALRWLCQRHEPLRTGFEELDGEIMQRIAPSAAPVVLLHDLRGQSDAWEQALRLARQETSQPFDLALTPLVHARIMRVADDECLLLLVLHHILGDGWSSRILVRELGALYAEAVSGKPARLQPLPLTYKDFAVWQRAQRFTGAADFWRKRLAGAPPCLVLPTTRPVPAKQSYRGATCRLDLEPGVLAGLRALSRAHKTTLGPLGLALFAALLYRLTRQRDMVLGMGVAGRDRAGLEGLIGFFVNVLPIRLSLDDDTELDSLIAQTREAVLEALDQRDYPFDLLVRDLAPPRQGNRQPLINVVFEYQNFGEFGQDGSGLPVKVNGEDDIARRLAELVDSPTAKHDLLVFLVEEAGRACLQMEYDTDILDAATAERWLTYLAQFMTKAAESAPNHTQAALRKEPSA